MHDWNAVVTVQEGGYEEARRLLERFGRVERTDFFNVLLMQVGDYQRLLDHLREEAERDPRSVASLARVMPVILSFDFHSPAEFEEKARQTVTAWIPTLGGKSFHIRMHRRGFKGKLSSVEEEKFLDTYLLEALEMTGNRGRIDFKDPDAILAVETIGSRAGLSLWTRDDLKRYPLLHLN